MRSSRRTRAARKLEDVGGGVLSTDGLAVALVRERRSSAWRPCICLRLAVAQLAWLLLVRSVLVADDRGRPGAPRRAHAEREREAQRLRARALEVLEAVTAAGGRLALTADYSEREVTQITDCLVRGSLLPDGQRLAHEPTRMDPVLGVTAYLEPDFAALTPMRAFKVPQQLRGPHPAVTAFQEKREHVSRGQFPVPPGTSRGW
jgi:hypothetical protein